MTVKCGDITAHLTHEQVRVMCMVARGLTYQQIGVELGYSERAVCQRVCDVKNQLGTESRNVALLALVGAGILS